MFLANAFEVGLTSDVFIHTVRLLFQTNEKLIEHLWAPNLHFLTTERFLPSLSHIFDIL